MKVTIALSDDELYRSVRVRAAQTGRPIRDLVEEAITMWLEAQEEAEDREASEQALAEYTEVGGLDAERYFARLVTEGRVVYETPER